MVLAYHIIFSTYGFWLPNDPRGSWSTFVGAWDLFRYGGKATTVTTTRSFSQDPHDRAQRARTKQQLKYKPVKFTGRQALIVAKGFRDALSESAYVIYALAILPDHVHAVLGFNERPLPQIIGHLKSRATTALRDAKLHPFEALRSSSNEVPTCWGGPGWKVYINSPDQFRRAVRYVENNPLKEAKPRQVWSFVKPLPQWIKG